MALTFTFDAVAKTITVEQPDTEVTVQQVYDAIRDWEDELVTMQVEQIVVGAGKDSLGGGVQTGITLKLVNGWRLKFADRSGPTYVRCKVTGGNLIATNSYGDDPIKPSAYTQVLIAQSTSASLIQGSGGATAGEIADAVWDETSSGHTDSGKAGKQLWTFVDEVLDALENRLVVNESTSEWWLYNDAGTSVIKKWPLKTKTGGNISVSSDANTERGARTL